MIDSGQALVSDRGGVRRLAFVGFAGGLNIQTINVDYVDDDLLWELDEGFSGILAAVTFHF